MLHGAGIFTHSYPQNIPNVGKNPLRYTINGAYGKRMKKSTINLFNTEGVNFRRVKRVMLQWHSAFPPKRWLLDGTDEHSHPELLAMPMFLYFAADDWTYLLRKHCNPENHSCQVIFKFPDSVQPSSIFLKKLTVSPSQIFPNFLLICLCMELSRLEPTLLIYFIYHSSIFAIGIPNYPFSRRHIQIFPGSPAKMTPSCAKPSAAWSLQPSVPAS